MIIMKRIVISIHVGEFYFVSYLPLLLLYTWDGYIMKIGSVELILDGIAMFYDFEECFFWRGTLTDGISHVAFSPLPVKECQIRKL